MVGSPAGAELLAAGGVFPLTVPMGVVVAGVVVLVGAARDLVGVTGGVFGFDEVLLVVGLGDTEGVDESLGTNGLLAGSFGVEVLAVRLMLRRLPAGCAEPLAAAVAPLEVVEERACADAAAWTINVSSMSARAAHKLVRSKGKRNRVLPRTLPEMPRLSLGPHPGRFPTVCTT